MEKHIKGRINVLKIQKRTSDCVKKVNGFFMLDIMSGMAIILLVMHLFLNVLFIMVRYNQIKALENVCPTFYVVKKIAKLDENKSRWKIDHDKQISTDDVIVTVAENGSVSKRSGEGGYEYIARCSNLFFKQRGEKLYAVFSNEEVYALL